MPGPSAFAAPGGDYFVFASPSEREGSKHADMAALEPLVDYARAHPAVEDVDPGVGYWADGKEESGLAWVRSAADVPRVAADLRDRFNQKATIGFAQGLGDDAAHILRVRETDPDKVHADLSRHGVEYKTVVPGPHGATVYVLDSGRVLSAPVRAYANEVGAHLDTIPGTVHFEGGDERPRPTKGTSVKLSLKESINKARREGDQFVKEIGSAGSPYAEHAAARVFSAIGLPHLPIDLDGEKIRAPWTDGLVSASDNHQAFRRHVRDTDRIGALTLGEWLVGAGDRIGRNYQTHDDLGLIGNDYGHAFHPLTDQWPDFRDAKRTGKNPPVESYKSLASSPNKWAEYHPHVSALPGLLRHLGLSREEYHDIRVPGAAVEAALKNSDALVTAARDATRDLPEDERALAAEAMRLRLSHLKNHLTTRGTLTIRDLVKLTEDVRREAERRTGPRPG